MSVFENELEQLERIAGIRIAESSSEYLLTLAIKDPARCETWHKPEPLKIELGHWVYLWTLLICEVQQLGWLN